MLKDRSTRSIGMQRGETNRLKLSGGRILGYDQYGDQDGQPVIFFHGTPGSRLDWGLFGKSTLIDQLGIRLIAIDRPGMGYSTFQPGRRFLDWPQDVIQLADALQIEYFSILGYSSGGAYALACALEIPYRIRHVGVVSGDGPYYMPGLTDGIEPIALWYLNLSRRFPWLFRQTQQGVRWAARHVPGLVLRGFGSQLPEVDKAIFGQPEVQKSLLATLQESTRNGTSGGQLDTALMLGQWDFNPQDISLPVHMWYGEADHSTSPAMGHYLAKQIPQSIPHFYPGEGHLSLLANHAEEILKTLTA